MTVGGQIRNIWIKICPQEHEYCEEGEKHGSLNTPGNLLATLIFAKELLMVNSSHVNSTHHVVANKCVGNSALVCTTELAVRSIVGVQRVAKTDSEDAIVPRVSAEAGSVLALQRVVNAILMSAGIVGLAVEMVP